MARARHSLLLFLGLAFATALDLDAVVPESQESLTQAKFLFGPGSKDDVKPNKQFCDGTLDNAHDLCDAVYNLQYKFWGSNLLSPHQWNSGLGGINYWQQAVVMSTLFEFAEVQPDKKAWARNVEQDWFVSWDSFRTVYRKSSDDTLWFAWANVGAYFNSGNTDHNALSTAQKMFDYTWDNGYNEVCGGGLYWTNHPNKYKNAITNELAILVAAGLAKAGKTQYLDKAKQLWSWMKGTEMISRGGPVPDGLEDTKPGCPVGGNTTPWSYNSGVILGALGLVSDLTGDSSYVNDAIKIADQAIPYFSGADNVMNSNQITNMDRELFNGIFVMFLGMMMRSKHFDGQKRASYQGFLKANRDAAVSRKNNQGLYPAAWDAGAASGRRLLVKDRTSEGTMMMANYRTDITAASQASAIALLTAYEGTLK